MHAFWSTVELRRLFELSHATAERLSRVSRAWSNDGGYGWGDYGDLAEARSAANKCLSELLKTAPPSEITLEAYVVSRTRRAVLSEWKRAKLRRRMHASEIEMSDNSSFADALVDRMLLNRVADVCGHQRFANLISVNDGRHDVYLPNGMRLRCSVRASSTVLEERLVRKIRQALAINVADASGETDLPPAPAPLAVTCVHRPETACLGLGTERLHAGRRYGPARQQQFQATRCRADAGLFCDDLGEERVGVLDTSAGYVEISDAEWERIRDLLPHEPRHKTCARDVVNGIRWVLRYSVSWHSMPRIYGAPMTCYERYKRWRASGVWGAVARVLGDPCPEQRHRGMNTRASPRQLAPTPSKAQPKPISGRVRGLLREAVEQVQRG